MKTEERSRDRWRDKDGRGFESDDRNMTNPTLPSSVIPTEIKMVKWRRAICAYRAARAADGSVERSAGRVSLRQMCLCKISVGRRAVREIDGRRWRIQGNDVVVDLL